MSAGGVDDSSEGSLLPLSAPPRPLRRAISFNCATSSSVPTHARRGSTRKVACRSPQPGGRGGAESAAEPLGSSDPKFYRLRGRSPVHRPMHDAAQVATDRRRPRWATSSTAPSSCARCARSRPPRRARRRRGVRRCARWARGSRTWRPRWCRCAGRTSWRARPPSARRRRGATTAASPPRRRRSPKSIRAKRAELETAALQVEELQRAIAMREAFLADPANARALSYTASGSSRALLGGGARRRRRRRRPLRRSLRLLLRRRGGGDGAAAEPRAVEGAASRARRDLGPARAPRSLPDGIQVRVEQRSRRGSRRARRAPAVARRRRRRRRAQERERRRRSRATAAESVGGLRGRRAGGSACRTSAVVARPPSSAPPARCWVCRRAPAADPRARMCRRRRRPPRRSEAVGRRRWRRRGRL